MHQTFCDHNSVLVFAKDFTAVDIPGPDIPACTPLQYKLLHTAMLRINGTVVNL